DLYRRLIALKKSNSALHNGAWGARMIHVPNSTPSEVLSFVRQNDRDKVFAVLNLSPARQTVTFQQSLHRGTYRDYFSGDTVSLTAQTQLDLQPWSYHVFVKGD
ncbi:MAG TPA: alpha amylase C-terminal domain-containing protein, partial [Acidobacteriota bacterium]|nr:alpha amylase C-terminal domain-containing protein [Acidobacteriota bacterium]